MLRPSVTACSVLMSTVGPPFDREGEELRWCPTGTGRSKHLNLMGRRNRSRFFKGLDVQSQDIQQLKQDCKVLNISWPALQRTGSDLPPAVQESTLNANAMETDASRS